MKVKFRISDYFTALEGLEEIKNIEILENDVIIITYTITKEYMDEKELYHKNRILKIDLKQKKEFLKVQDYANIMED